MVSKNLQFFFWRNKRRGLNCQGFVEEMLCRSCYAECWRTDLIAGKPRQNKVLTVLMQIHTSISNGFLRIISVVSNSSITLKSWKNWIDLCMYCRSVLKAYTAFCWTTDGLQRPLICWFLSLNFLPGKIEFFFYSKRGKNGIKKMNKKFFFGSNCYHFSFIFFFFCVFFYFYIFFEQSV